MAELGFFLNIIFILISYLIGSVPFGYVFVKIIHKRDIRKYGSGNIGATNIWRAGYKALAILTFLFDAGKALLAIGLAYFYGLTHEMEVLCGFSAIFGHIYSIFLKFNGGKGISTLFGYLLFLSFKLFWISCAAWVLIFIIFRISSLASVIMLAANIVMVFFLQNPLERDSLILISLISIYKHKGNIYRLFHGKEKKI